jgi:ABC-type amino acid transport substrate-binding protein
MYFKIIYLSCFYIFAIISFYNTANAKTILKVDNFKKEKIIIGLSPDYPPFEFIQKDKIVGFDIDIANEIGRILVKEVKFVNLDFYTIIPAINSNKIDLGMSGITRTPIREEKVNFSTCYYKSSLAVLSKKDKNLKDFYKNNNITIGFQTGTTMEEYAKDIYRNNPNIKLNLRSITTNPMIIQDIKTNHIDYGIFEEAQAKNYVNKNKDLHYLSLGSTDKCYAIAIKKGNQRILTEINAALIRLEKDGTLNKIYNKWFQ